MDEQKFKDDFAKLKAEEQRLNSGRKELHEDSSDPGDRSRAMRYATLGLEFAIIFAGSVVGSNQLDKYLGTSPWLTLVGITLGFSLALYRLIFVARSLSE